MALAGGGPGGGTRTSGQAEVLAFPQASLPACIRPRISGRDTQYAVVPSRVQDGTGRGSGCPKTRRSAHSRAAELRSRQQRGIGDIAPEPDTN
jgi:hypothetical protein